MKRRCALAAMVAALVGCAGQAGGSPALFQANIVAWGDSLTDATGAVPGYVPQLRSLFPGRTVYDGGVWGQQSPQILTRVMGDTAYTGWINVFWIGRNNFRQPEQVKSDIAAAVAHLAKGNDRFLVLSIINSPAEPKGSADYATIVQLNADLAATHPAHFVDVRSALVAAYDPALPSDVADHANDVPPLSLRADGLHLNATGCLIVALRVKAFVTLRSWAG